MSNLDEGSCTHKPDSAILRTFSLPHGYTVTFCWTPPGTIDVIWTPDLPHIVEARPRRKFDAAYQDARRLFFGEVAAVLGGNVMLVTPNLKTIEVVSVPTRH